MITVRIIVLFTVIVPLHYDFCWCRCAGAEYEIDGRCCPMCAAGNRVYWPCTEDTSTTCAPCPDFTHIDEPSSYTKCFDCTVCDASRGIRVKKACTRSSDTVCEPLEQFYCTERNKDSCRFAVKHSECSPGQYIKQAGTPSTDTVCADCEVDTYSNGSFSSCLPHTQCEALGLTETSPGTQSSDSECGNTTTAHIAIVIVTLIIIIIAVVSFTIVHIRRKKRSGTGIQGTGNDFNETVSMVDDGCITAESNGLEEEVPTN
ncbi:tumor necrosis factor receptor superfamily member 14-like isoform X2 [Ctenopharyngodon idella]|uniref:tumor necrosis factor receptor superfamily member 14-like isoform X2 n=1 Tax=Ctenopharyngodon idella TaxID=7959 RepID=UPI00223108E0|nr:tumor necrosis factor receptor superfamily member 14-like isoform X2 [Ctenopharyngodon idella]